MKESGGHILCNIAKYKNSITIKKNRNIGENINTKALSATFEKKSDGRVI